MSNFLLALQSAEFAIRLTFASFVYNEGVWGFAVGFAAATVIYAFFLSEHPQHIPTFLTNTAATSFTQIAQRDSSGKYLASYTAFQKEYTRVRIAFYFALLAFFLVILVALLRL